MLSALYFSSLLKTISYKSLSTDPLSAAADTRLLHLSQAQAHGLIHIEILHLFQF